MLCSLLIHAFDAICMRDVNYLGDDAEGVEKVVDVELHCLADERSQCLGD